MKRFFSSIVLVIIAIIVGFWLSSENVLQGTKIGEILSTIVTRIPVPTVDEVADEPDKKPEETSSVDESVDQSTADQGIDETTASIDYRLIEDQIFAALNQLRREKSLPELTSNAQLQKAARKRAQETEESFSHTRPDGTETFTILKEAEYRYTYQLAGENLGMATNYLDEAGMAELLFKGWKDSPGHYENMIREEFTEVGVGVSYDGENIYAVQLFGTPL